RTNMVTDATRGATHRQRVPGRRKILKVGKRSALRKARSVASFGAQRNSSLACHAETKRRRAAPGCFHAVANKGSSHRLPWLAVIFQWRRLARRRKSDKGGLSHLVDARTVVRQTPDGFRLTGYRQGTRAPIRSPI